MTDIWQKFGDTWTRVGPSDFQDEDELHDRIIEAPEMLPLSGQPKLVFAGKKVRIGGGEADVLAVDTEGRPTIIEVKLKKNPESRRAVVAQTLAYAAWLHGATVEELEGKILGSHLGSKRLVDALSEADFEGALDHDHFYSNLAAHLSDGSFRLVIVLDDAPEQLVRLTGYLEAITTDRIAIDLVTVTAYEVNGAQVLLPQRIDPERQPEPAPGRPRSTLRSSSVQTTAGSAAFRMAIDGLGDEELAKRLRHYVEWAEKLEAEGLCRLDTGEGTARYSLRLRLVGMNTTIVALVLPKEPPEEHHFWIQIGVAKREAPEALPDLIKAGGLDETKQAGSPAAITNELLDALTQAYREAARKE